MSNDVITTLRTKARTFANNDNFNSARVRVRALGSYTLLLRETVAEPQADILPLISAYASHLDTFLYAAADPAEFAEVKQGALGLPIRYGFLYFNACARAQPDRDHQIETALMFQREIDIPTTLHALLRIAENRKEVPSVRIEAIRAFSSAANTTQATFSNKDFNRDEFDDRLTVLALSTNHREITAQAINLGIR